MVKWMHLFLMSWVSKDERIKSRKKSKEYIDKFISHFVNSTIFNTQCCERWQTQENHNNTWKDANVASFFYSKYMWV